MWHPRIEAEDTEERSQYVRLRFDEEQQCHGPSQKLLFRADMCSNHTLCPSEERLARGVLLIRSRGPDVSDCASMKNNTSIRGHPRIGVAEEQGLVSATMFNECSTFGLE